MSKNEKQYILQNYNQNGYAAINLFCDKKNGIDLFDKFCNSIEFDSPDMYYINNQYCYIFEHFEIDASLYKKGKGSAYKRNSVIANQQLEEYTNDIIKNSHINNGEISSHGTCAIATTQEASKDNLKANFFRIFDEHYNRIETYKDNLKNKLKLKNPKFKTIFIIEETTEFGGFYIKDGKQIKLELFCCDFVLDKLKTAINVDYFIFLNRSNNKKFFTIVKNNDFSKLKKYIISYDKEKIFFINNVTTLTTTVFIPRSKL